MPGSIHHMLVSTATGLVLLGSTAAFAEHKDTIIADPAEQKEAIIAAPDVQRTDARTSDVKNTGLTGGFYAEKGAKDASDDWYYDFYETPSAERTSDRTAVDPTAVDRTAADRTAVDRTADDRKSRIMPDAIRTSERVQFVDAARPVGAQPSNRSSQGSAFTRYYDEPWYYEQPRDTSYTMPVRSAREDSYRSTDQAQEMVKGNITHVKQVRNTTRGGQNTVVHIKPLKGNLTIVDLGPTQPLLRLALTEGDSIAVGGQTENIGPYSVLMAHQVRSGANNVIVDRVGTGVASDRKEATGRIDRFSDVRIRGTEQMHRIAAIKGDDGRLMLVDLGPATAENVPANAAPGDRMSASGPVATVGTYPVLFADRMSIENGVPVKIARPDGGPGASRQDMEASQILESPSTPQPTNMPQAK